MAAVICATSSELSPNDLIPNEGLPEREATSATGAAHPEGGDLQWSQVVESAQDVRDQLVTAARRARQIRAGELRAALVEGDRRVR